MKRNTTKQGVIGIVLSCALIMNFMPMFRVNAEASTDDITENSSLVLSADTNTGDDYSVNFSWNDISSDNEKYDYRLLRSEDGGKTWETRSSWDGEKVKVLNVYPDYYTQNFLIDWMNETDPETGEPAGKGLFEIDTVYIDDYNNDPEYFLYDDQNNYKYDVILFGTCDSNAGKDLSEKSQIATMKFVNSGRGVLFGHDSLCANPLTYHPNFASFSDLLGINASYHTSYSVTNSVAVVDEGFLTSFPWHIEGQLTVPYTHNSGQFAGGILDGRVWMKFVDYASLYVDPDTGATNDYYLVTNNNLAMIQTGHSNGQATIDECKVIANTLFYLKQTSSGSSVDNSFYDKAAPERPNAQLSLMEYKQDEYSIDATLSAEDIGSEYLYKTEALPRSGLTDKVFSNTVLASAVSELRGFVAITTDSEESAVSEIEYDKDGKTPLNVIEAKNGSAVFEMKNLKKDQKYYLHVFAIDNANNISEEYVKEIYDNEDILLQTGINCSLESDKTQYEVGQTVTLTAASYTTGSSLNANADIVLENIDGTQISVIAEDINEQLTSDSIWSESFSLSTENLSAGSYIAVLKWRINNTVVAESKCLVNIVEHNNEIEFSGTITVSDYNEHNKQLNYSVTNNSDCTVKDAIVIVYVDNEDGELVSVTEKKADFAAKETKSFDDSLSIEKLRGGNYKVILSVNYDNMETPLAESGFSIIEADKYTVTFKNYDGTVIGTQQVQYGQSATAPETPKKPSDEKFDYKFDGWDKDFSKVVSDLTVTAVYKAVKKTTDANSAVKSAATPDETITAGSAGSVSPKANIAVQTGQSQYALISVFTLFAVFAILIFLQKMNERRIEK